MSRAAYGSELRWGKGHGGKMKTYKSAPRIDAVVRFSGEPVPGPIPDALSAMAERKKQDA